MPVYRNRETGTDTIEPVSRFPPAIRNATNASTVNLLWPPHNLICTNVRTHGWQIRRTVRCSDKRCTIVQCDKAILGIYGTVQRNDAYSTVLQTGLKLQVQIWRDRVAQPEWFARERHSFRTGTATDGIGKRSDVDVVALAFCTAQYLPVRKVSK